MMRTYRRPLVLATVFVGAVLAPLAPNAFAQHSTCRSDPVVSLAGGVTIDLTSEIGVAQSDVSDVQYVIHAPAGTTSMHVTFTRGKMGKVEHFSLVDDAPAGTFISDTTVTSTQSGSVLVSGSLYGGHRAVHAHGNGVVGQDISVTL